MSFLNVLRIARREGEVLVWGHSGGYCASSSTGDAVAWM